MAAQDARTFLGFDTPFLHGLSKALLGPEFRGVLGSVVVVLPGRRAGRRLLELLALESGAVFEPPRIVTEAGLAQALSVRDLAVASLLAVECSWLEVISSASAADLALFAARVAPSTDGASRLGLARQLAALDRERLSEEWTPEDPLIAGDSHARARVEAIARWSQMVSERLAGAGLMDPTRVLEQLASALARRPGVLVVLAGIVELSALQRSFLDSLVPGPRVFIQAGPECSQGFDRFGTLIPDFWEQRAIPLRDDDWRAVTDPAECVAESVAWLSRLPCGTTVDQIALATLGLELVPGLQRALEEHGLFLHVAAGRKARHSAAWNALSLLNDWILREDFAALAAIVRHADLEAALHAKLPALQGERDPARDLDLWHSANLPDSVAADLCGASKLTDPARSYRDGVRNLCGALGATEHRALAVWIKEIAQLVCRIYPTLSTAETPGAHMTRAAVQMFADVAQDIESFCARGFDRPISAGAAMRMWLEWTGDRELLDLGRTPALEALGWLELSMEEAPFLLLLGFNDGWVPQVERVPRLVPQSDARQEPRLRQRTRLARDVHALTALVLARNSDARVLGAISLRRGLSGDPLRPSRLLFHCEDASAISRAEQFFGREVSPARAATSNLASTRGSDTILPIPDVPVLESMSVTSFKAFLESPYRFYLQELRGLERVRDDAWEMDSGVFGTLAHAVLKAWGKSPERHSVDEGRIKEFVVECLHKLAGDRFGAKPLPAVRLQLQQLKRRLLAFARAQAEDARETGWRVHEVEFPLKDAVLVVDGSGVAISGIVDRIDQHSLSGAWRVLDYKTGAGSDDPLKAHRNKKGIWKDLQLPLYRHFLTRQLASPSIELGYFSLPATLDRTGVVMAEFKPEELDKALAVAQRVVQQVRAGEFAELGRGRPTDRAERALCGVSLLLPPDEFESAEPDTDGGQDDDDKGEST